MVGVDGRVQTRSYEGQDGKTVYVTEVLAESIQFLESRGSATGGQSASGFQPNQNQNQFQPNHNQFQPNQNQPNQNQPEDPFSNNGEPIDISDDDLPF